MTTYGVTPEGFIKKPLSQILQDIGDSQRATFGAAFDTSTSTAMGQLNGTWASAVSEVWEILEAAFHGFDPDAAADYLLTVLAGLTGTERRAAVASVSKRQQLTLNAGATVNAGALIAHASRPDIVFATDATVNNPGGSTASFEVTATCTQTGPLAALAGTLTVIVNPVSGWTATTNLSDAIVGRDVDSDIILRQRREEQLALRGGSTAAAIQADLLDITTDPSLANMRAAQVLENTDDVVVDGMLPHSIEALIDDGDTPSVSDDLIAQIIFDGRAAGIQTNGSTTGNAIDGNGDTHVQRFSRATLRPVFIDLTLTKTEDYPVDGDDQVKQAITAAAADYRIGDMVIALHLRAAALTVAGVIDVPAFTLDFTASPINTGNLVPGLRARATFASGNIAIT